MGGTVATMTKKDAMVRERARFSYRPRLHVTASILLVLSLSAVALQSAGALPSCDDHDPDGRHYYPNQCGCWGNTPAGDDEHVCETHDDGTQDICPGDECDHEGCESDDTCWYLPWTWF